MYEKEFKEMPIPEIKKIWVTPELAQKMLNESDFDNRNESGHIIAKYSNDIKSGRWDCFAFNPILSDTDENIRDSHHRLKAVIHAGIPVPMYIALGVSNKGKMYDRGKGRTTQDVLKIEGYKTTGAVIALTKWLFNFCFELYRPSDPQVILYIKNHENDLEEATRIVRKRWGGKCLTRRACAAGSCYQALRCGVSDNVLNDFFEKINSGFTDAAWQSASTVARNFIIDYRPNSQRQDLRVDKVLQNAIFDYNGHHPRKRPYSATNKFPYRDLFIAMDTCEIQKIKGNLPITQPQ